MASGQSNPSGIITREAARDLSSYQYCAMKLDTSEYVDYGDTSAGASVIGVLQNAPDAAGGEAEVATEGTSLLKVNANSVNIAVGDKIGSDSAYCGVKVALDTEIYFAIALQASTADGDLIEVKLLGGIHTISV